MLILDEIMATCNYHLVPEEWLVERLQARPETAGNGTYRKGSF